MAIGNFKEDRAIGKGGFGTVYKGVFPDGKVVAVKKLQMEGTEGEKEFRAKVKILSGHGFGWPHPNLVTLYSRCLYGSLKILVYEYIGGGSLENLVTDKVRLILFVYEYMKEVLVETHVTATFFSPFCDWGMFMYSY
ncbi:hypothetical protein PIB30_043320 [Stylosanthes scabra]|uniref:Protein kinase domain-containing protein n=1 Tax=Stylosanthes scabra TaxID=79078 RepID=A0ABU6SFR2_9FABA|nr:hypothetical protein [Stylosanthes scabra]